MTATAKKTKKTVSPEETKTTAIVPTNAELVTVENLLPATIFTAEKINEFLALIKAEKEKFVGDVSTKAGIDAIKSFAFRFTKTKTLVDEIGKDYVAILKDEPKRIDALRKQFRDQLDAWAEEVRAPVTAIEAADAKRKEAHEKYLKDIGDTLTFPVGQPSSAEVQRRIDFVVLFQQRNWEEYDGLYQTTYKNVTETLAGILVTAKTAEDAAAELAKLKADAAKKAEDERVETARLAGIEEGKKLAAAPAPQPAPAQEHPLAAIQRTEATKAALYNGNPAPAAPQQSPDVERKAKVLREVLASLMAYGTTEAGARALIAEILKGKITHVSINFGE